MTPSMSYPPSLAHVTPTITSADIASAIFSFSRGLAGGSDGMRPQFLQDMLLRTAAPPRDRILDILTDFVRVMLKGQMNPDLCPLVVASASLFGIPKPAGGISPIAVGLTLRRLAGKVAGFVLG